MLQSFTIPAITVSWNILARQNRWKYKTINDEWHKLAAYAILRARIKPVTAFPVHVHFHARWKKKMRHDIDSLFSAKPVMDVLVTRKIIPDDNLSYVSQVTFTGEIGADRDELVVTISE